MTNGKGSGVDGLALIAGLLRGDGLRSQFSGSLSVEVSSWTGVLLELLLHPVDGVLNAVSSIGKLCFTLAKRVLRLSDDTVLSSGKVGRDSSRSSRGLAPGVGSDLDNLGFGIGGK